MCDVRTPQLWDIFCRVVDNYGDIGVCWRLAADLARRGEQVRLWIDDPRALRWMAPGAQDGRWSGIQVMPWEQECDTSLLALLAPADVWIEGFGCEIPEQFLAHRFDPPDRSPYRPVPPVWVNLEYLTAETFAERAHALPSPVLAGPASGQIRHFFYPGFTSSTGGLLREPGLAQRQSCFDRLTWLANQHIAWQGERLVVLFCYEPTPLASLLAMLALGPQPTRLLVTAGRAAAAVARCPGFGTLEPATSRGVVTGSLTVNLLGHLAQPEFDHLLWSGDLNFVRGEDSLVRALWAGKPLVWQIYPQHDNAHHTKLHAFLQSVDAPASWQQFHLVWNGLIDQTLEPPDLVAWGTAVERARERFVQQDDLVSRLLTFVGFRQRNTGSPWQKS